MFVQTKQCFSDCGDKDVSQVADKVGLQMPK
jgi:hypothetical protein